MNKKSILIIGRYFYPEQNPRSFRTTELSIELSRQGYDVTVLTPKLPLHNEFELKYNLSIEDLGQPKWKAQNLKGTGVTLLGKKLLRRAGQLLLDYPNIEFYFLVRKALKKQLKINNRYDLLISIAVPHAIHWGVSSLWKNNSKKIAEKWIADCGDPFMGQENDAFKHPFYFKYIEKWFCKKADYITIPIASAISAYYPEFHDKIRVIPQGFNFDEIETADTEINDYPTFAYAGGLIPGRRDPKDFFNFLINYDLPYKFDLYTNQKSLVQSYADRSSGRIRLKDYLPRKELLFELSKLDFVVNFENAGEKQTPSKLIDYAIIKKPILSVNSFNFNETIALEFLEGSYERGLIIKNRNQYRIQNIAVKFLQLSENKI
jgi:hypothetical protein